jgi:hypothetical protein
MLKHLPAGKRTRFEDGKSVSAIDLAEAFAELDSSAGFVDRLSLEAIGEVSRASTSLAADANEVISPPVST